MFDHENAVTGITVDLSCLQVNTKPALALENSLASEEAVVAAAAAEAVALAKAALKGAQDAVMLVGCNNLKDSGNVGRDTLSEARTAPFESVHLAQPGETRRVGVCEELEGSEMKWSGSSLFQDSLTDSDDVEPSPEELEILQSQLSNLIAVKSSRQSERKARRARAVERAAANVVSVKSGSTGRRKRASVQEVDYSDPLRYLRGTTSNSRLLTASEEQELSRGIQVCFSFSYLYDPIIFVCFPFKILPLPFSLATSVFFHVLTTNSSLNGFQCM